MGGGGLPVEPSVALGGPEIVNHLYARSVFFVNDAERALQFYTEHLGFAVDWNYKEENRAYVCQVSLLGFELILNQTDPRTQARAGHGRAFIGLDEDQAEPLLQHFAAKGVKPERQEWGRPTLVIKDLDANEVFFWMPQDELAKTESP